MTTGRLGKKLDAIRSAFADRVPEETRSVMRGATQRLIASGQAERALGVGGELPSFTLPDQDGRPVSSADVLERGPLILTFFRGRW